MKIDEALIKIEEILRQLDPLILFESSLGKQLNDILRKLRDEKREDVISDIKKL
ncbi:hypothetical protein LCGC14_2669220 [marine sediment metagenome]|uniref:Uncharacterized protein n=1 Tax=marine sediment metagenome TaxID=412755 RepID=A0A0F9AC00_9ZZZZ